ncbi:histidine phosphatase superfamily [Mycena belliarum]|uniref:Histidine phosphatase superfamily n=1 Tax=Mycena belliarum TaxID=1033014 RepID=A0AAD6U9G4_9AGAR|nr:histidine phosphatase superfamily [Mycena belliae]
MLKPKTRVTFTFVRHGESTDNTRAVWAGWTDATLTRHGMNQAEAVAASLADEVQFTAIHSSPLKRAYMTAQVVHNQQLSSLPVSTSPLLREQHFGSAEGKPWTNQRDPNIPLAQQFKNGIYPTCLSRNEKFPNGESLAEVQIRACQVWEDILLPYVREAEESDNHVHVAVVSHGIFIKEAVRALGRYDSNADLTLLDHQSLRNTAWARVVIGSEDSGRDYPRGGNRSPLQVQLTHFNVCGHLTDVRRQKGGIGREAYDPRQRDIRGFFVGRAEGRKSRGL